MTQRVPRAAVGWVWLLVAVTVHPADWPQFRGPTGDGLATEAHPPITWSPTQNLAWKVAVPGRGRSSPVLLRERIWLTTALETNVRTFTEGPSQMQQAERVVLGVVCLEKSTGRQLYYADLFSVTNPTAVNSLNSYATPTPVVEKGRLYCDFGTFGTACLEADTGRVLWQVRFPLDHAHGPGSSPVLCGNLLVLVRDGRDQQYVVALNKTTGETVWKSNRPPLDTPVPEFRKSFSTPLVVEVEGRMQLVSSGAQWLVAYEPETGKEIWRVNDLKGESGAPRPVYGRGVIYFSTGVLNGRPQLWAVRANGHGDVTQSHVAWKLMALLGFMPSPLLVGSELYLLNDEGFISCVDAEDGRVLGKARLGGNYAASPVYADGHIYCCSREGKTTVLEAGPGLKVLAENQLDGPVFASPAFGGAAVYLRTDSHLYRVSSRSPAGD
jgi:outer membrane protein assembly factor BamB